VLSPIIDVNAYVGTWPYWNTHMKAPESLLEAADTHGISQLWITSLRAVLLDWVEGNDETYEFCEHYCDRLLPVITASPFWIDDIRGYLDRCADRGMAALRLFPVFHGYALGEYEELLSILHWANERRMPIIYSVRMFMNWGVRAASVSGVELIARHAPNCPTILSGVNWGEIMETLTLVERFDNLHFDLSCLALRRGIELLLKTAGPDRVLFGTGMPFQSPGPILAHLDSACLPISSGQRDVILGGNAARMLNAAKGGCDETTAA